MSRLWDWLYMGEFRPSDKTTPPRLFERVRTADSIGKWIADQQQAALSGPASWASSDQMMHRMQAVDVYLRADMAGCLPYNRRAHV